MRLRCRTEPAGNAAEPVWCPMTSLVLSTIAFFVASFYIKRYLDGIGVRKTMTRGLVIFVLALAVAYGVAFIVDLVAPGGGFSPALHAPGARPHGNSVVPPGRKAVIPGSTAGWTEEKPVF